MSPNLSSKADKSSVLYCGRALIAVLADSRGMIASDWRERLAGSIKEKGRSLRDISLKAGMGAGYLHGILVEGKDPTIGNMAKLVDEIGVSLSFILYGYEMDADSEALLRHFTKLKPSQKRAFLDMARTSAAEELE